MNENAWNFRKITMKVLSIQLNSLILMDIIIAFGGSDIGIILALHQYCMYR